MAIRAWRVRRDAGSAGILHARCRATARPGNEDIQLDLFLDYANNVALYPKFQEYFRQKRPPLLAVWGKNDPFFLPRGAEAFRRDIPNAEIFFYDTGHFALETHAEEIGTAIHRLLGRTIVQHA